MKTDVRKYWIQTVEKERTLTRGENTVKGHTGSVIKTSALIEFWFNVITLLIIYKVAQCITVQFSIFSKYFGKVVCKFVVHFVFVSFFTLTYSSS